jgi:hypothetical protein
MLRRGDLPNSCALRVAIATLSFISLSMAARAAEVISAEQAKFASQVENEINVLGPFPTSTTVAAINGKKPKSVSFRITSHQPVFGSQNRKWVWLVLVTKIIGGDLGKHPEIHAEEVFLSDPLLACEGRALSLSCALAMELQAKNMKDEISLDELYAAVERNLVPMAAKSIEHAR